MVHGLIIADNTYADTNHVYLRGTGAHRIATHLRQQGWRIEVVDFILRWCVEEFQSLCETIVGPDTLMLGISSNLMADSVSINEMLAWFRDRYPKVAIVLGGNHLLSRDFEPVDYFIEGYAEDALSDLLQHLAGHRSASDLKWSDFRPDLNFIDATRDYGQVNTHDLQTVYHESDFVQPHEVLALETGRGCIFRCRFCTYPLIGKKNTDYLRDPVTIAQELEHNWQQLGVSRYIIAEDTFNDSVTKLENLRVAIQGLTFRPTFVAYLRFDLILKKPETLTLLREIGIRAAYFGIETFDDQDGRIIRKGSASERIKQGLLWWAESAPDIATHVSMIAGLPHCTEQDLWAANTWLEQSGLHWWSWNALWFTDVNKTIHTSEFSRTYQDHGYEIMTEDEVRQATQDLPPAAPWYQYNTKTYRQKMIFWKHQANGMNFFRAAALCDAMNSASRSRRLGGFHVFQHASLDYDIDTVSQWGYHDVVPAVPQQEIEQRAQHLIAKYKRSKLGYDYASKYAGTAVAPRIFGKTKIIKRLT